MRAQSKKGGELICTHGPGGAVRWDDIIDTLRSLDRRQANEMPKLYQSAWSRWQRRRWQRATGGGKPTASSEEAPDEYSRFSSRTEAFQEVILAGPAPNPANDNGPERPPPVNAASIPRLHKLVWAQARLAPMCRAALTSGEGAFVGRSDGID